MNTNVDVLAVLDALEVQTRQRGGSPSCREIAESRNAVADLIEAMEKLFGADMEHCMEMDGKEDQLEAVQFAKSALARVKGY